MATNILVDARIFMAGYNISSDHNAVKITNAAELKDDTVFGATYRTMRGGGALIKTKLTGSGFVQAGTAGVEDIIYGRLGTDEVPITLAGEGGDAGEGCLFFKGVVGGYDAGASVGEMFQFNFNAEGSGLSVNNPLVRGTIFEDSKTSRTSASNTATRTLGAVSATQKIYAAVHCTAFVGTSVTFTLKSAVTDWATPTTHNTFTAISAIGSQYMTPVAGSITNTFWRFEWTGTFTSFSAMLVAGIL